MSNSPTVIMLAAGENSRFFPFNTSTHKGALPLLGLPMVVRTLRNLEEHHFKHVVLIVSEKDYGGKGLSGVLSNYTFQLTLQFVLQPKALGMGDAILCAEEHISGQFAVISPVSFDAGEVISALMKSSGKDGAVLVSETAEPWLYGIVTVDGKRVMSIIEKPEKGTEPSNLKIRQTYLLSADFLQVLKQTPREEYSFETALDTFFAHHDVRYSTQNTDLPSLKYAWHLFDFQHYLFSQMHSATHPTAQIAPTAIIDDTLGPVIIEEGARVSHAAKIVGPAYIGKNVLIGDYCFVRSGSIEEGSTIGSNMEVVRTIVMQRAEMHFGYIADSIVGNSVKIGAGLITANKRHDREHVRVEIKGKKVDIGRNHLGVMIGEGAKLGVRTTTMPGVAIGARAITWPCVTVYKHVKHDEVMK